MDFALRPETPDDSAFLFDLFRLTHGTHLAMFPEPMIRMQFDAQRTHYRGTFPQAHFEIITLGEVRIGRLVTDRGPARIRLVDVALLPEYQGRGMGSAVIRNLQQANLDITLSVQVGSPARRLYERFGFAIIEDRGIYLEMEWRAAR